MVKFLGSTFKKKKEVLNVFRTFLVVCVYLFCTSSICVHRFLVCLCVSRVYPEWRSFPLGCLRHQLAFLLQEMDAADYYQKIHKFFMGKLKL